MLASDFLIQYCPSNPLECDEKYPECYTFLIVSLVFYKKKLFSDTYVIFQQGNKKIKIGQISRSK